jgi:hypothetical protein
LNINDTGKDEILDKIMEKIVILEMKYYRERGWLGSGERASIREEIAKHRMNYNTIVTKRADRAEPNRIKSLHVPGPMSEAEKLKLIQLIEST